MNPTQLQPVPAQPKLTVPVAEINKVGLIARNAQHMQTVRCDQNTYVYA